MTEHKTLDEMMPLLESVFSAGGCFRIFPRGTSMLPLLREGKDSVLLSRKKEFRRGDIVLCKRENGTFVLHRIVAVTDDCVVLLGDNHPKEAEETLKKDAVLSSVITVYRNNRPLSPRALRHFEVLSQRRRSIRRLKVLLKDFLQKKNTKKG